MQNNTTKLAVVMQYLSDSAHGISEYVNEANDYHLKSFLKVVAKQRLKFIKELRVACQEERIKPNVKDFGVHVGPLHQWFIDLKMKTHDNISEVLKEEIVQSDKVLMKKYDEALNQESNEKIKLLLDNQLNNIYLNNIYLTTQRETQYEEFDDDFTQELDIRQLN